MKREDIRKEIIDILNTNQISDNITEIILEYVKLKKGINMTMSQLRDCRYIFGSDNIVRIVIEFFKKELNVYILYNKDQKPIFAY